MEDSMAITLARVELHDENNYDKLHLEMASVGFHQSLNYNKVESKLPIGEYCSFQYDEANLALAAVERAVMSMQDGYIIALLTGDEANFKYAVPP
jgi:hypothetical protein